jgi:POT family proton-dependent oligopeptide transporter
LQNIAMPDSEVPPAKHAYRTTPLAIDRMPPGIPYIIGNEAAERFSFYGMRAVLTVYMTDYLLNSSGVQDTMSPEDAKFWMHTFIMAGYAFPLLGAVISDWLTGKYPIIVWLSIVYCFGHLALAVDETRVGLAIGLSLIALGMGAIKPCVSAHVGDQFGPTNKHLLGKVFGWFYLSINAGAFLSSLLTPILLNTEKFYETFGSFGRWLASVGIEPGPSLAFGVPGVLMALATFIFWLGRNKYVHIPPRGGAYLRQALTGEGLAVIKRLAPIYLCVAAFWCLFDQTTSAWVIQAKQMDTHWLGHDWLPSQLQAVNPLFILILTPLFTYVVYPALGRVIKLTPLRIVGIGMFTTVPAFLITGFAEQAIAQGYKPTIGWQVLAYAVLTAAEVMVSITCLEFSYTQAPNSMKSIIMSIFLLSVALGNEFTAVVNLVIQRSDGTTLLPGASYYWFFSAVMAVAACAFVAVAMRYREHTFIQGDQTAL